MKKKNSILDMFKSEFVKNMGVLIGGNVSGQAIVLLTYPILSRLYTESDFGVFASFMTVTGLLVILSTGKYEEALVLTKDKEDTHALFRLIIRLLLSICCIIFVVLFFCKNYIFKLLQLDSIYNYWYLIPCTVFFLGLFYSLTYFSNRESQYKQIARANLSYNGLNSAFKIGFYYLNPQAWGLIAGNLLGLVFACLSFPNWRKSLKGIFTEPLKDSVKIAIRLKDFPLFSMNRAFISALSAGLPMFLFPGAFGQAKLGLYFMAFTLLFRPVNLISSSLYQIVSNKFASAQRNHLPLLPLLKKYCLRSILCVLPGFILAGLISESLFSVFLGESWRSSGIYFRLLLPWVFMVLLTTPLGFIPMLFNKQGTGLWMEIVYLIARMLAIFIGIRHADLELSIALFSGVGFVFMTLTLLWYVWLVKKSETQLPK